MSISLKMMCTHSTRCSKQVCVPLNVFAALFVTVMSFPHVTVDYYYYYYLCRWLVS